MIKKMVLFYFLAVLALALATLGLGLAEDVAVVLEKVDGYRRWADSFTMEMKLSDYDDDQLKEEMSLFGYFCGDDKSVLVVRSGKNKGMKVLLKGDDMWVNLPGSKRGLRITPMQRLMGQASNGDVAKVSFSRDYKGTLVRQDAAVIILDLRAKSPGATYQRALLTVDSRTYRPIKAEFFLLSGKHFKTAHYLEFSRFDNHEGVSRLKIEDRLNPKQYTIIESGNYHKAQIPEKYFNVMYLPNLELNPDHS